MPTNPIDSAGAAGAAGAAGDYASTTRGGGGRSIRMIPAGRESIRSSSSAEPGISLELRHRRLQKINSPPYTAIEQTKNILLNGEAVVRAVDSGIPTRVVCKDFAFNFVTHASTGGTTRALMAHHATPEAIAYTFGNAIYSNPDGDQYSTMVSRTSPESKHLFSENHLGRYLETLASSIPEGVSKPYSVRSLLISDTHALAVNVQSKSKQGVDYYSVSLYDPNTTASYKRVEVPDAQSLRTLTLRQMMVEPSQASTYGGGVKNDFPLVAVCADPNLRINYPRGHIAPTPDNMNVAAAYGSANDVHALLQAAQMYTPPRQSFLSSMLSNHPPSSSDMTASLLAAKNARGIPGLAMAINNNHPDTVAALIRAILTSAISAETKMHLLQATKAPEINTGMQHAMIRGNPLIQNAFIDEIAMSHLGGAQKAHIIRAEGPPGISGLASAIHKGNWSTVGNYTEKTLSSSLSNNDKYRILSSSSLSAKPGLSPGNENNRIRALLTFTESVINSELPRNMKASLMEAHKADFARILFSAFSTGSAATANAFTTTVINSSLDPDAKFQMLDLRDSYNVPVSRHASQNAFANGTVDAFTQPVLSSNLSNDQKRFLTQHLLPPQF